MASYIAIANSEIDPDSPITADLLTKFRDNPLAVFTGDASVPSQYRLGVTLGTIATTSGSSVTLSGLTLTSYRQLQYVLVGVSTSNLGINMLLNGSFIGVPSPTAALQQANGGGIIDLATGAFFGAISAGSTAALTSTSAGNSGLTTASTSITFTLASSTFDAGSIVIYGIK